MKNASLKALTVAATLFTAGGAEAYTVNLGLDTGWQTFNIKNIAGASATKSFTFTLTGYALLTITDGYLSGDRFQLLANNVSRGLTSLPAAIGAKIGNKWTLASTNSDFSHRSYKFGPGTYTIDLLLAKLSPDLGTYHIGAMRLDTTSVPVPAAGLMLLTALGAAGAMRKRGRTAA